MEFDYRKLETLIHSPARLGIMTILISGKEVDFNFLKEKLDLSDGNLSVHLLKLEDAKYINVKKIFCNRRPRTFYKITPQGKTAFQNYIDTIEKILKA
jgi:DNA-binding MarR family transcriptional regulator